jgi:hypothetical protein
MLVALEHPAVGSVGGNLALHKGELLGKHVLVTAKYE